MAARVDATWRWIIDEADGHSVGDSVHLAGSVLVGWRLIVWRHFELTPEVGFMVARDWTTAELSALTSAALAVGLTAGYIW